MENIDNHILWKITTTYDLLFRMRKKFSVGDLSWDEYAAIMEPKCIDIMKDLLRYVESGDFLDYHRKNMKLPEGTDYPGRDKNGYPFISTSESVIKKYNEYVKLFNEVISETDSIKKTKGLIIGFDSFVGWMHGSFELSRWVIKQCPFTGDWNLDYDIALDTMTICSGFSNATMAIQYLRDCEKSNNRVKVDWKLVREESAKLRSKLT
jgi:hypothetical protein